MEGVYYELDTEGQFWGELDEILNPVDGSSPTEISVETAVRNFIRFAAAFRSKIPSYSSFLNSIELIVGQYLSTDEDVELFCATLFRSQLFIQNAETVRYELISIANEVYIPSLCVC